MVLRTPDEMKEAGNQYYREQNYQEALNCYTQAISKYKIIGTFITSSKKAEIKWVNIKAF